MEVSGDDGKQCYMKFGKDSFLIPRKRQAPEGGPLVDHICYTIEDWDKDAVEAELRRRGLNPEPDTDESFHVRDPDGYRLQICERPADVRALIHPLDEGIPTDEANSRCAAAAP